MQAFKAISLIVLWCCIYHIVLCTPPVRPGTGNPSPRLPRTSASQLSQLNNSTGTKSTAGKNAVRNGNLRTR